MRSSACVLALCCAASCKVARREPDAGTDLARRIEAAWAAKPPTYRPRTRHLRPDGTPKYTNRLFLETSPYLLQHAHNPVDWYPWGDEAFEAAKRLGRPVLLSVGYSTCHWCHVMEEESFEDEEIAAYLNAHYVAIKVDREERPDIDAIYMTAVNMLTGDGGWPMTVWLTPERKPFYGGTYFPARDGDRGARTGFLTVLRTIAEKLAKDPALVASSAEQMAAALEKAFTPTSSAAVAREKVVERAMAEYASRFDPENGGLRGRPKFPSSLPVRFLLRAARRDARAKKMAEVTLEKMASGGMYDQLGGGFHRYSTDERWRVPHFEKMLYDNALLAVAYLEGWQATGREELATVAKATLQYVASEMTSPSGAFYSATDADSPGPDGRREEGLYFTWTPAEIGAALPPELASAAIEGYGVTREGDLDGRSVLVRRKAVPEEARIGLLAARAKRPPPLRDEKRITAWNGLMISAFARASRAFGSAEHAAIARRAAEAILSARPLRRNLDKPSPAYLDDHAFFEAGLIDLFEATGERRWLDEALAIDRAVEQRFEDGARGGFFSTGKDHEALLAREKASYDGSEPSGSSVQAMNLLRLAELTSDDRFRARAERTFAAFAGVLERSPAALSEMLLAIEWTLDRPKEIVIVGDEAAPFLERLGGTFLPHHVLVVTREGSTLPIAEGKKPLGGKTTAYVCERGRCELPTTDPARFAAQLR